MDGKFNCDRCFKFRASAGVSLAFVDFGNMGIFVRIQIQNDNYFAILYPQETIDLLAWLSQLSCHTTELLEHGRQVLLSEAASSSVLKSGQKAVLKKAASILQISIDSKVPKTKDTSLEARARNRK